MLVRTLSVYAIMVMSLYGLRLAGFTHTNIHLYTHEILILFEN